MWTWVDRFILVSANIGIGAALWCAVTVHPLYILLAPLDYACILSVVYLNQSNRPMP